MRSVVPEDSKVGLLLFDEPSAALDPVAEHGEWIPRPLLPSSGHIAVFDAIIPS